MKKTTVLVLIIAMIIGTFNIHVVNVHAYDNAGLTEKPEDIIEGTFTYMPAFSPACEETFYYSDSYFSQSGTVYNEHLLSMSLCLELSTFQIRGDSWVRKLYEDIGFTDIETMDMTDGGTPDTIGTAIAHKKINDHDVVAIAIRGEKYEQEWVSNFIAGLSGDANGFADAAQKVNDRIKDYIDNHNLDKVKIWMTGYSRSGAVADLSGAYINKHLNDYNTTADDIYIYMFETPNCSLDSTVYDNMYDVINPNDLIPNFYSEVWGFSKNGKRVEITESSTIMTYCGMPGEREYGEVLTSDFVKETVDWLSTRLTRDNYANNLQEPLGFMLNLILSKTEEEQTAIKDYFLNVFNPCFAEYREENPEFTDLLNLMTEHESEFYYNKLADIFVYILDTSKEKCEEFPLTEEDFEKVKSYIIPIIKVLAPIAVDDFYYYPDRDYDAFYEKNVRVYQMPDDEMGTYEGSSMGESDGYTHGFDDEEYNDEPEFIKELGQIYTDAYSSAYKQAYAEGYALGQRHRENLAERGTYDGITEGYTSGFASAVNGNEKNPVNEYFYESDWMTAEYIEAYNKAYAEEYLKGYDEGLSSGSLGYDESLNLYHLRTLIRNYKEILANHYPQRTLSLVRDMDSYYGKYKRTIMLYICGSNLESWDEMATHNLNQIFDSEFSENDDIKVIAMTGGARRWYVPAENLYDPATGSSPGEISNKYNQIWEIKGADATETDGNTQLSSKMILIDGDGVTGDGEKAKTSPNELMTDPDTLKAFINYTVNRFPAEKYDLVLWDHGSGPDGGYGYDEFGIDIETYEADVMTLSEIVTALSENDITLYGDKFDFIDFDTCLMNSVELNLLVAPYTDYYIASALTEPSYGQEYSGWISSLKDDPDMDGYELGKIIVDSFIKYYDEDLSSPGYGEDGTLAVVNSGKLQESGFLDYLTQWNDILYSEITTDTESGLMYYDELDAVRNSYMYTDDAYRDFGNLLSIMTVAAKEVSEKNIADDSYTPLNDYKDATLKLLEILNDETIIYAGNTQKIETDYVTYMNGDGDLGYGKLPGSGMYIFFPNITSSTGLYDYFNTIKELGKDNHNKNTDAMRFLSSYLATIIEYSLVTECGQAVSALAASGIPKNEIDYEKVREYWKAHTVKTSNGSLNLWDDVLSDVLNYIGGEEYMSDWLSGLISQQAADAVIIENISVAKYKAKEYEGFMVNIKDTYKRIIDEVEVKFIPELTAVKKYLEEHEGFEYYLTYMPDAFDFALDTVYGSLDSSDMEGNVNDSLEKLISDQIKWYSKNESTWIIPSIQEQIYALQDAEGRLHAANCIFEKEKAIVHISFRNDGLDEYFEDDDEIFGRLIFESEPNGYRLSQIYLSNEDGMRPVSASMLNRTIQDVHTCVGFRNMSAYEYYFYFPLTLSSFSISKENADSIRLVLVDTDSVEDIEGYRFKYVIKDIYEHEFNISDMISDVNETIYNIDMVTVSDVYYNGSQQGPRLSLNGSVLREGIDYTWQKVEGLPDPIYAGYYEAQLEGIGNYTGRITVSYNILPGAYYYSDAYNTDISDNNSQDNGTDGSTSDDKNSPAEEIKTPSLEKTEISGFEITKKGNLTVAWTEAEGIEGYELQFSTDKSFDTGVKTVRIKDGSLTQRVLRKLKSGKTYYFRIRSVKGKDSSAWSKTKKFNYIRPYITATEKICNVGDKFYVKLKGVGTVSYSIKNEKIATVNEKGKIKIHKAGTTKLTILGENGKKYTCVIVAGKED